MKCWECEQETNDIHHHHVVPRSRGGTKTVPLCVSCHSKAHHRKKNMNTSQLTREALAAKKARGERLGRPPYGFSMMDGSLVPNEDFAALRTAVTLRERGMTIRQIAAAMKWNTNKVHRLTSRWSSLAELDAKHPQ